MKTRTLASEIKNEIYELLLKSVPYNFANLDFSELSVGKVSLLIKNDILIFNSTNYKLLKETFIDLHIVFIELNKTDFIKDISGFELDAQDILLLLKSSKISIQEKNTILEAAGESFYSSEQNSLKII